MGIKEKMGLFDGYENLTGDQALAANGFNPDGSKMTDAEQAQYVTGGTQNIPSSTQQVAPTNTQSTDADADAAVDAQNIAFLEALGAELNGGWFNIGADGYEYTLKKGDNKGDVITVTADDAKNGYAATRQIIEDVGAGKTLNAFVTASPELKGLVDIISADNALATQLQRAIVADPTVLPGLQSLANGTLKSENGTPLSLSDVEKALGHKALGGQLRKGLTDVLNTVTNIEGKDGDFKQVLIWAQNTKDQFGMGEGGFDYKNFIKKAMTDPGGLIMGLTGGGFGGGTMSDFFMGFLKNLMPILSMFGDPNGAMLKPYVDLGKNIFKRSVAAGEDMRLNPTDVNDNSHVDYTWGKENFTAKLREEYWGKENTDGANPAANPAILTNTQEFVSVLEKIDPTAKEEVKLVLNEMETNPELLSAVSKLMNDAHGDIDVAANSLNSVYEFMTIDASPADAFILAAGGKVTVEQHKAAMAEVVQTEKDAISQGSSIVSEFNDKAFITQFTEKLTAVWDKNVENNDTITPGEIRAVWEDLDPKAVEELQSMATHTSSKVNFNNLATLSSVEEIVARVNDIQNAMEDGVSPVDASKLAYTQ